MLRPLFLSRRFAPVLWCLLLSATNDNFVKAAFAWLVALGIGGRAGAMLNTLAGVLFAVPLLLMSGLGGELADRWDKAAMARRLKFAGIAAAGIAAAGMFVHSFEWLLLALLALGVVNALFSPIAYGILPDHLRSESLPAANALLVTAGFAAMIAGTAGAGLAMRSAVAVPALGAVTVALALLAWIAARAIIPAPPAAPTLRPDFYLLRSTLRVFAGLWREARLRRLAVVIGAVWLSVALVTAVLPTAVMMGMHGTGRVVTIYTAILAASVGLGAALAAWLAAGRLVLLPSVLGAMLIAVFALDLGWHMQYLPGAAPGPAFAPVAFFARPGSWRLAIDLALIAIGGGLAVVPCLAALEGWAAPERRARTVAAANLIGAVLMAFGVLGAGLASGLRVPDSALLFAVAVIGFALARWILISLPAAPLHELLSILLHAVCRLEVHGLENLDKAGPRAIIALNHVSFLDAAAALSILSEEPVFAVDHDIAQRWWARALLSPTRTVPLNPAQPLATRRLIATVRDGRRLVIFLEGRMTVTGRLMQVCDGAAMIAEKAEAAIIPVRLDGFEATMFSPLTRGQVRRRLFPKVRVTVLEPVRVAVDPALKGKARRHAAGAALHQIMSDLIFRTTATASSQSRAAPDALPRSPAR